MPRRAIQWEISKAYDLMTEASCRGQYEAQQRYAAQWRQLIAERDRQEPEPARASVSLAVDFKVCVLGHTFEWKRGD